MTTLVKIHRKGQMTLPSSFRAAMGVGEGSLVELSLKNGKTVITPKLVIDRSKFPTADDEYTPEQRRIIDAGIVQGRKGPYYGPFKSGIEVEAFLKKWKAKTKAGKLKKTG
jgi:AbrB family looped-hinge helix DNA binding protein